MGDCADHCSCSSCTVLQCVIGNVLWNITDHYGKMALLSTQIHSGETINIELLRGCWFALFGQQLYASKNNMSLNNRMGKFWGHVIIQILPKLISVRVGNFPPGLRYILSFPGYCRQFTTNFTALTLFLTNLLCKNHGFQWLSKTWQMG